MKQLMLVILILFAISSQTALGQKKKSSKKMTPKEQQTQKAKLGKEDAARKKL